MRKRTSKKYPEVLAEVAVKVTEMMIDRGEEERAALDFGLEVAEMIRSHWGGEQIYISRGSSFSVSARNQALIDEFNGTNHHELAIKYNIVPRHVYGILAADRANKAQAGKIGRRDE